MDNIRKMSILGFIITIILTIALLIFGTTEVAFLTAYCCLSISLFLYTLSKQSCISNQNKLLYEIMKYSKKVKKIIIDSDINSKQDEPVEKIVYMDGATNIKLGSKMAKLGSMTAAASFFNLPSANAIKICCNPVFLKHYNFIKMKHEDLSESKKVLTDNWLIPGPEYTSYDINNTYYCTFTKYCTNIYYRAVMDSVIYIAVIVILSIAFKIALYSYSIFKTPVSSVIIEYNYTDIEKANNAVYKGTTFITPMKRTVTKYKYCSIIRLIFCTLYVASFTTAFLWVGRIINIIPSVDALNIKDMTEITINNKNVSGSLMQYVKNKKLKNTFPALIIAEQTANNIIKLIDEWDYGKDKNLESTDAVPTVSVNSLSSSNISNNNNNNKWTILDNATKTLSEFITKQNFVNIDTNQVGHQSGPNANITKMRKKRSAKCVNNDPNLPSGFTQVIEEQIMNNRKAFNFTKDGNFEGFFHIPNKFLLLDVFDKTCDIVIAITLESKTMKVIIHYIKDEEPEKPVANKIDDTIMSEVDALDNLFKSKDFIGDDGELVNLDCFYDYPKYILNGVVEANCSYNPATDSLKLTKSDTYRRYSFIDDRCSELPHIVSVRNGVPFCYEVCTFETSHSDISGKRYNPSKADYRKSCSILFRPNDAIKNSRDGIKSDTGKKEYTLENKVLSSVYERYTITIPGNINSLHRHKRSLVVGLQNNSTHSTMIFKTNYNSYGEGTYIMEGWVTQFQNSNGGVFMAELDNTDIVCYKKETVPDHNVAICSHKRRMVISCEPNLYSDYTTDSNIFSCRKNVNRYDIPIWRQSPVQIPYSLPFDFFAGDIPHYTEERVLDFDGKKSTVEIKMLYGKKFQDSIQTTGNIKYFTYSAIFKITQVTPSADTISFIEGLDDLVKKYNVLPKRSLTVNYFMDRNFKPSRESLLPSMMLDIKFIHLPGSKMYRQDRAYVNFVMKSNIYFKGKTIDPLQDRWQFSDPCFTSSTHEPCVYLLPIHYIVKVNGPALIDIKFFDRTIDTIAFDNDVCSSVNAYKVRGICYFPDIHTLSSEATVTDFPWTRWSMMATSNWLANPEFPSFYGMQPVAGSGQYLEAPSAVGDFGYYSTGGKCTDIYYNGGKPYCNSDIAIPIKFVEIQTFHRPLMSPPVCKIHENQTLICETSDPIDYRTCNHDVNNMDIDRFCHINVTKKLSIQILNNNGYTIKTPISIMQLQRGSTICKNNCLSQYFRETYYRCAWCIIVLMSAAGIGYVAFICHLLLVVLCYLNKYNIGRAARRIGLSCVSGWQYTPICAYCNLYIYSEIEKSKHDSNCNLKRCPYCITLNKDDDICYLEFPNKTNFKQHMSMHQQIRVNPYLGIIKIKRTRLASFILVPIILSSQLYVTDAQYFPHSSGLRSNRVGVNLSIPSDNVKCTSSSCSITSSYHARIPLTDGSTVVLKTVEEERHYSKKLIIDDPHMNIDCDYLYTASNFKAAARRLVYVCLGKTECNSGNAETLLTTPLANREFDPSIVPIDSDNPLKSYYCPKSIACSSPIVDFMWLSAGCWTVDDGTAVGYEYYVPKVNDLMAHIFKCNIRSVNYKVCEGSKCQHIDGSDSTVNQGEVKFEHISDTLPIQFTVGATAKVGEDVPNHLYFDVPDVAVNTDNTILQYRMTRIPQSETCVRGTEYNSGSCEINSNGMEPALNCHHSDSQLSDSNMIKLFQSLNDVYHCNFENTNLIWNTELITRKVMIGGEMRSDTQKVSWPSLNISSANCNFGHIDIDLISMSAITMELVRYRGHVSDVKCEGFYNRNNMARLVFVLTDHSGMFEFNCPNLFTQMCIFDTAKSDSCNVTMLLPHNSTCRYLDQYVNIDCSMLAGYEPDPTSGHTIGFTGSELSNTWISGFALALGKWWVTYLLCVGCIIVLIFLAWLLYTCCHIYVTTKTIRNYSNIGNYQPDDYESVPVKHEDYSKLTSSNTPRRRLVPNVSKSIY